MKSSLAVYAVAISFAENGPLACNAIIAPSPETAAAIWAFQVARMPQVAPDVGPIAGVQVTQLDNQFLERALRLCRGDAPAQVLSIVPTPATVEPA